MKIARFSLAIFILLNIFTPNFALKNICKLGRRQMTVGQSRTDCYSTVTCLEGGVISRRDSCPRYLCEHELRGYKQFDHRKPYPDCCGGPRGHGEAIHQPTRSRPTTRAHRIVDICSKRAMELLDRQRRPTTNLGPIA